MCTLFYVLQTRPKYLLKLDDDAFLNLKSLKMSVKLFQKAQKGQMTFPPPRPAPPSPLSPDALPLLHHFPPPLTLCLPWPYRHQGPPVE